MGGNHLRNGVLERLDALSGDRGDGIKGQIAALGEGGQLLELGRIGHIDLGGDHDRRLGGQRRIEGGQLVGDDFEVGDRVGTVGPIAAALPPAAAQESETSTR